MMIPTSMFQLLNSVPTKDLIGGLRGAILSDMNPRYQEQNRKNITERASEPVFEILGFHMGRSAGGDLILTGAATVCITCREIIGLMDQMDLWLVTLRDCALNSGTR